MHDLGQPELDAVAEVLANPILTTGAWVERFEKRFADYLKMRHAIGVTSCTGALHLALIGLGVGPGDEVITTPMTFIASSTAILEAGAKPVFVDVEPETGNLDVNNIEAAITERTKAIVPVHLYGHAAPMEEIMAIAAKHNLFVIEDNAQAIGCDYTFSTGKKKKTGSIGHIGTTSFYPSKNLGAFGDGGAIFTNDDALAVKMKMIANHGQSKRYYHDLVGCNSRLDSVQAAILDIKLKHLDEYIIARRKAADFYDKAFAGNKNIITPFRAPYSYHVFHQYTLQLDGINNPATVRDALNEFLAKNSIPSMIYYPVPGHRQKVFEQYSAKTLHMPTTDWLTERVISLPMHTELDDDQLAFISSKVLEFINNNS